MQRTGRPTPGLNSALVTNVWRSDHKRTVIPNSGPICTPAVELHQPAL